MAAFIVIALALSLLALATVLRPLWRDARPLALGTGLVALLSAGLLYLLLGAPQALDPANRRAPATLQEAVAQLQAALERNPQQPEGWALLGQAYLRLGDATRAMQALARAARLTPSNPDILTDAAQARALADPAHRFDAQAVALLESALAHNPGHQRARWYLGVAQRQAGQNAEAAATWAPLLTQVDATTAASLRREINAARTEAGLPPLPPPRRTRRPGHRAGRVGPGPGGAGATFARKRSVRHRPRSRRPANARGGPETPVAGTAPDRHAQRCRQPDADPHALPAA